MDVRNIPIKGKSSALIHLIVVAIADMTGRCSSGTIPIRDPSMRQDKS
jgi:hypothetical protein